MLNRVFRSTGVKKYFSTAASKGTVSFFGLGNMGIHMAHNLAKAGYTVYGFDLSQDALSQAEANGCIVNHDRDAALKESNFVVSMVPNSQIARGLLIEQGVIDIVSDDTLIIDSSTIAPSDAIFISDYANSKGKQFVDAPVSGGVMGAQNGTLAFMVGASNEGIFNKSKQILDIMGGNIFNCETPGGGQIAKTCNNMALAIQMASVAEALSMAKRLGLNPDTMADIMKTASSRCWSVDTYPPLAGYHETPVPADNNYEGGFATDLLVKDLNIAIDSSNNSSSITRLGHESLKIYTELQDKGLGSNDFSIVYKELLEGRK